jgi:hypothetical protein
MTYRLPISGYGAGLRMGVKRKVEIWREVIEVKGVRGMRIHFERV